MDREVSQQNGVLIRDELPGDALKIRTVINAGFNPGEGVESSEAILVDALRASGDVAISLVADRDSQILGHILFSKLKSPRGYLALAPLSVLPRYQGRGYGSLLVRTGLKRAKACGWTGVFVLGDPQFYKRFGFSLSAAKGFITKYQGANFMALDLKRRLGEQRRGSVVFAPPFNALG